jgi:putative two-component system response regulator
MSAPKADAETLCAMSGPRDEDRDGGLELMLQGAMLRWAGVTDPETEAHVERVAGHARRLSLLAGLDRDAAHLIGHASRLHDVGKIGVPSELLATPGPLSGLERREVERHAEIGHYLLRGTGLELLDLAATIALTHHERYDGTGYPRRLVGEETPLAGRITAIADVFDALTSPRVYRPALDLGTALRMMRRDRARHFDPILLDLFLADVSRRESAAVELAARPLPVSSPSACDRSILFGS